MFSKIIKKFIKKSNEKETLFHENDYANREKYRPDYAILCNALDELLDFQNVIDLGSANGFIIDDLTDKNKSVIGVELSKAVFPYLSDNAKKVTKFSDATTIGQIGSFDLVTCIEVAEHIPPEKSELLIEVIARNSKKWIYFTAAPLGQSGVGHINCRPHFYWLNEFKKHDIELDYELTSKFIKMIENMSLCTWLSSNSFILRNKNNS